MFMKLELWGLYAQYKYPKVLELVNMVDNPLSALYLDKPCQPLQNPNVLSKDHT
jgi:hypothetical protein